MSSHSLESDSQTPDPLTPQLEGVRVRLRPLESADHPWLFQLSTHPALGYRWRHLPGTLNPEQLSVALWQGILTQLVIEHRATKERLGLVICYNAVPANRTAYLAIVLDPGVHRLGWPLEGFKLFVRYLFTAYDLRKVYAEAVDYNLAQYEGLTRGLAVEEGVLREHVYAAGRYRDVHILAFYRSTWLESDELAGGHEAKRDSSPV